MSAFLGPIHYWLYNKIQVQQAILDKSPSLLADLEDLLSCKGKELAQGVKGTSVTSPLLFKIISDNLLDGMPCDHANSLLEESDDCIVWKRNLCVHSDYWDAVRADISIYYKLRDAWIYELVMECEFTCHKIDSVTYSIEKTA